MFDALQDSLRLKTGIVGLMRIFANYAGFLGRKRKMVVGEGAAPPGTLIWRFPGFIRPRCTAGATHKAAESYQGIQAHRVMLLLRTTDGKEFCPCGLPCNLC